MRTENVKNGTKTGKCFVKTQESRNFATALSFNGWQHPICDGELGIT